MQGKAALVTGASSGIGLITARELSKRGAHVILVCRDKARGEAAQAQIREAGGGDTELLLADMSSQQSIRALASQVQAKHQRLDVLVNNAGGINGQRELTVDGLEKTFATNHLGYFLLTNLLLDLLKKSAPARIISLASRMDAAGSINFDDLMGEKRYLAMMAYSNSKLANVVFTFELAKRLEGTQVTAFAVHPGSVATNFGMEKGGIVTLWSRLIRPLQIGPEKGADTVVWLASAPEAVQHHGQYLVRRKRVRANRQAYQPEVQKRLWQVSEQLCGLAAQNRGS